MQRARPGRIAAPVLTITILLTIAAAGGAEAQTAANLETLNKRIEQLYGQGKYAEATAIAQQALILAERMLGKDHPDTLAKVHTLAVLYYEQGRYSEAEPFFRRALEACERVFGKEHPHTLTTVNNLAELYNSQGRTREAEPLLKRALEGQERVLGKEHPQTLFSLNNLALLYMSQGRYGEAEPLYRRALKARERVLGKEHPDTLTSVASLADFYEAQGRYGEAEALLRRVLEAEERVLGMEHPRTLTDVNNLGWLYQAEGRYVEAEPLFRRALEGRERVHGREHPYTLTSVNNLAELYQAQGRYSEAEPLLRRALEASERVLGREHPQTLVRVNNLAGLFFTQGDWTRAAQFLRRSTAGIAGRTQRDATVTGQAATGKKESEVEQNSQQFWILVKAVYRLAPQGHTPDEVSSREMFQTAQWAAGSEAAKSLAQMSARGAKNDPALAALARERQDMVVEWRKRDAQRNEWLGNAPDKRDPKAEAENNAKLAGIDARIGEIDKQLAAEFPDYAALASPAPAAVDEVQAQLRADEALVLFLDTPKAEAAPEETFIWVVTKSDIRWVRSALGTGALAREVAALRCGLDASAWEKSRSFSRTHVVQPASASGASCQVLLGQDMLSSGLLPFDLVRAHALYTALFGQVEDLIQGKQLLIVPSGPLTALPFQALVTEKPDAAIPQDVAGYAKAKWLGQRQSISVLPAVSSLKALRRHAGKSSAPSPYIGFGNPLLTGESGNDRSAWAVQWCKAPEDERELAASARRLARPFTELYQTGSGVADVEVLRRQPPLPDTADELCAVARLTGAAPDSVYLGPRATEAKVKTLSQQGELAKVRVIHFATHGLVAGETQEIARARKAEPAMLLTPPQTASEEDDGLLTATEVAALKLDADWVILSACNTAAGGEKGAEALSGLARAFFYAGARALLVSHWYVNSAATVELITRAFGEMQADPAIGRAEAMRRAMGILIAQGGMNAHPAFWAPFAVAGEGGATR